MDLKGMFNRLRFGDEAYDEYEDEYEEYEDDYEEEYEEVEAPAPKRNIRKEKPVVNTEKATLFARQKSSRPSNRVIIVKPTNFDEVLTYCDYLLEGKTVVINMEGLHIDISRRIIDVVTGAIYSIKGHMEKISTYIVIATPESVELSGDFADIFTNTTNYSGDFNLKL